MAVIGDDHADHVVLSVKRRLRCLLTLKRISGGRVLPVNLHPQFTPPGVIAAFMRTDVQFYRTGSSFAAKLHSQKFAVLVGHGLSIILIERSLAIVSGINAKHQRSVWDFIGALD